ncbi:hypothetical protein DMH88_10135 [Escherichia coli]|nr:hypothetical protein [Escherichia coli]
MALGWHKPTKVVAWIMQSAFSPAWKIIISPGDWSFARHHAENTHFTALLRVIEDKGFLKSRPVPGSNSATSCVTPYSRDSPKTTRRAASEGVTAPPVKTTHPALPPEKARIV